MWKSTFAAGLVLAMTTGAFAQDGDAPVAPNVIAVNSMLDHAVSMNSTFQSQIEAIAQSSARIQELNGQLKEAQAGGQYDAAAALSNEVSAISAEIQTQIAQLAAMQNHLDATYLTTSDMLKVVNLAAN